MIAAPNPLSRAAVATWTLAVAALIALPLILLASPAIAALAQSGYRPYPVAASPAHPHGDR
jgi:hypothetical protein